MKSILRTPLLWALVFMLVGAPALGAAAAQGPGPALVPKTSLALPTWWTANERIQQWKIKEVFVGPNVALARIDIGSGEVWLAADATGEVRGPLLVPANTVWAGFGDHARVYLATQGGQLSTSSSIDSLLRQRPTVMDTFENIEAWDAGGTTVAALNQMDGMLLLSTDSGASFDSLMFDDPLTAVAVRSDNVVVVAGRALHLSRDGGKKWKTTQITVPNLRRTGQFIGGQEGCEEATLARDGKTWIPYVSPPGLWSWSAPFRASEIPRGWERRNHKQHQLAPLAPKVAKKHAIDVVSSCREGQRGGTGGGGAIGRLDGPSVSAKRQDPCAVTRCLQPPPSRTGARFLASGECGPKEKLPKPVWSRFLPGYRLATPRESVVPTVTNSCHSGALKRPGRMIVSTQTAVALVDAGCLATQVVGEHGLTAVLCEVAGQPETTEVRVRTGSGWVQEVRLEGRVRFADQSGAGKAGASDGDGTLVFEVERNLARTAWVRRPVAFGEQEAWREVAIDNAVAHRALTGGRVLVVASAVDATFGNLTVTSTEARPVDENVRLQWAKAAQSMTMDRMRRCVAPLSEANPRLQGRVTVRLRTSGTGEVKATIERLPVDDSAWAACLSNAFSKTRMFTIDRSQRQITAADVRLTIQFKQENHALDVWVADGTSQRRIATGVRIPGAVRDVRVRGNRNVEFDVGGPRKAEWVVVPTSGPLLSGTSDGVQGPKTSVEVKGAFGPRPAKEMTRRLREHSVEWGACQPRARRQRSQANGKSTAMAFQMTVSQHGIVLDAKATPPIRDWKASRCLEAALKTVRFQPTPNGISQATVEVSYAAP